MKKGKNETGKRVKGEEGKGLGLGLGNEEMKWERGRDEKREERNGTEERGVKMEGKF